MESHVANQTACTHTFIHKYFQTLTEWSGRVFAAFFDIIIFFFFFFVALQRARIPISIAGSFFFVTDRGLYTQTLWHIPR